MTERISRRDVLKLGAVGIMGLVTSNSYIGRRISELKPELPGYNDSLAEYQIGWDAKPWVWTNLAIAAGFIDGMLIKPGEEISLVEGLRLNKMADVSRKNTDPRNGYVAAQMMSGIDGWGYGLCLGSTSIFRAAIDSPLLVTERSTHFEIYPQYFEDRPVGTDAAIFEPDKGDALPRIDLKLANPTDSNLFLRMAVYDLDGNIVRTPDRELSDLWYKGAYLEHGAAVAKKELNEMAGIEVGQFAIPDYSFGNRRIFVSCAVQSEKTINYQSTTSEVSLADIEGNSQYKFTRCLQISTRQRVREFEETYISKYIEKTT